MIELLQVSEEKALPQLLDIPGLCKYLDISPKTAYIMVRRRDFPSFKAQGKYRIIVSELVEWMKKHAKTKK
jgi:predicted DNA-binding transcriptional regulator AlpA